LERFQCIPEEEGKNSREMELDDITQTKCNVILLKLTDCFGKSSFLRIPRKTIPKIIFIKLKEFQCKKETQSKPYFLLR